SLFPDPTLFGSVRKHWSIFESDARWPLASSRLARRCGPIIVSLPRPPPPPLPTRAGLSHMEKLRPYFTLRDGSDRRGNSVVPHWIRFCSGFDSVAVRRRRGDLPSIGANTTRAKPYAIALPLWGGDGGGGSCYFAQ